MHVTKASGNNSKIFVFWFPNQSDCLSGAGEEDVQSGATASTAGWINTALQQLMCPVISLPWKSQVTLPVHARH